MISILVPTRRRHHRVKAFIDNIKATVSDINNIELLLYIDGDDDATDIGGLVRYGDSLRVFGYCSQGGKPKFLSGCYNVLWHKAVGDILMYASDDIAFRIKGWDDAVHSVFNNSKDKMILYSYHKPVPMHGFISRKHPETLGFVFPDFEHGYMDYWLKDLYESAGTIVYAEQNVLDHLHWHANRSLRDEVYDYRTSCDDRDKVRYDTCKEKLPYYVEKLRGNSDRRPAKEWSLATT